MLACVAAVHANDIVSTDLKPANFVLVQGMLKIIDYGISGVIDIDNTLHVHRDTHNGTPNYMSPESLHDCNTIGAPCSGSTDDNVPFSMRKSMKLGKPNDVWSLGCILY
jgi:serine/threonine-protein kinase TTK/MPS1